MTDLLAKRDHLLVLALIVVGSVLLQWSTHPVELTAPATLRFILEFTLLTLPLLVATVRIPLPDNEYDEYVLDDLAVYSMAFICASRFDGPMETSPPHWAVGNFVVFAASLLYELASLLVLVVRYGYRPWRDERASQSPLGYLYALARRGWSRAPKDLLQQRFTNPFCKVLLYSTTAFVYARLNGHGLFLGSWHNLLCIALTVCVYMVATIALSLARVWARGHALDHLLACYSTLYLHIAMLAPLGIVLTMLWHLGQVTLLLLIAPILIMHASMQAVRQILDDTRRTIEAMVSALEERDEYTAGHSERVARYAGEIARVLGLSKEAIETVENAGRIHDLGKIDIPDAILRKPCDLDDEEYEKMKTHTDRTLDYALKYRKLGQQIPFDMAAKHHERFDGDGYVYGLRGDDIPLGARIISVADTWDAMTSDRPYRKGMRDDEALRRLEAASGTQFDPQVVEAFVTAHAAGTITQVREEWVKQEWVRFEKRRTQHEERRANRTPTPRFN
jgi:HD-GYP domain-containing protein (c-di-GMP phosphodiesterase class II)